MTKRRSKFSAFIISFFSLLVLFGCSPNEPLTGGKSVFLKINGVTSTKVWLSVNTNKVNLPAEVSLTRDDSTFQTVTLFTSDTIIVDDNLEPSKTYKYQLLLNRDDIHSKAETVTTLALSGNFFRKSIFTFDQLQYQEIIRDVQIISKSDIWIVGGRERRKNGQFGDESKSSYCNGSHWDGNDWEVYEIDFSGYYYSQDPIKTLFAFEDGNVWFSVVARWNGNSIVRHNYVSTSIYSWVNALWGIYENEYFTVGNGGSILNYKNGEWIYNNYEGFSYDFFDIYGRNYEEIYICGGDEENQTGVLVKGNADDFKIAKEGRPEGTSELFNPYFAGNLNSVWVTENGTVFFGGRYLYYNSLDKWDLVNSLPGNKPGESGAERGWNSVRKIRGNNEDDFVFIDEYNALLHFNGKVWKQLGTEYSQESEYRWKSVDMKGDVIVAVGQKNDNEAVVMILNR